MGFFSDISTKSASLVTAALEEKGAEIQASMLQLVNGADGQMLAGLLFLIAVAGGIITVAIGGSYLWARYLLVAPPLFFFLTQVTVPYAGTDWQFGDDKFPDEPKRRALRGVIEGQNGGAAGAEVSYFFQFWNVFMSDLSNTTLKLLNLTNDQSHLSFITKIERYMALWDTNHIVDKNLKVFIHLTMVPRCADYFSLLKMYGNPVVSDPLKDSIKAEIAERGAVKAFVYEGPVMTSEAHNEIYSYLAENGVPPGVAYSCQELWETAVRLARPQIEAAIAERVNSALAPNQTANAVEEMLFRKIGTETSRSAGMVRFRNFDDGANFGSDQFSDGLLRATDWLTARSLFMEINAQDRYVNAFDFQGHPMDRATGAGERLTISDQVALTGDAMAQYNETERYQFKGDYVNGALSLPHFQGVVLMLLSASYPFFAMAILIPGRASAIFTWMGLWAWVKMWDIGLGVVMMIDNILYAVFPRGPNLEPGEINEPGTAWHRIMEVDPNYSSAVYYNLIATCMYAVPVVTAVFVRGGGRELVNAAHGSWENYAQKLGGSAVTYASSLQAQSYAGRKQQMKAEAGMQRAHDAYNSKDAQDLRAIHNALSIARGMVKGQGLKNAAAYLGNVVGGEKLKGFMTDFTELNAKAAEERLSAEMNQVAHEHNNLIKAEAAQAMYDFTNSAYGYAAPMAQVAARYFSHDDSDAYPTQQQFNHWVSQRAFDVNQLVDSIGNKAKDIAIDNGVKKLPGGTK